MTLVTKLICLVIGTVSGIIVARWLGPYGKGILAIAGAMTGALLQFGNLGIPSSLIYYGSRDPENVPKLAGLNFWIALVLGTLLGLVTYSIVTFNPQWLGKVPFNIFVFALLLVPFQFFNQLYQNLLLAVQRIFTFNIFILIETVLFLVMAVTVVVLLKKGALAIILGQFSIAVLLAWGYYLAVRSFSKIDLIPDFDLLKKLITYGLIFYVNNFLAYLLLRSDLFLVNYFRNTSEAGIYSISATFADMLTLTPQTIGMILFPTLSAARPEERAGYTAKVHRFTVLLMLCLCVISAFIAQPLIVLLYGNAFAAAGPPILWLLPGIFFLSLETIFAMYYASEYLPAFVPISWAVSLALNVGLNIVLIPKIGIIGAAITSSIAYTLVFVVLITQFMRKTKTPLRELFILRRGEFKEIIDGIKSFKPAGKQPDQA